MQKVGKSLIAQARTNGPRSSKLMLGCSVFAIALTVWISAATPSQAQASDPASAAIAPASAATRADRPASVSDGVDDAEKAKFDYFDSLGEKGWEITRPTTADSVIADRGGVRSALAKYGIGFLGIGSYELFVDTLKQMGGTQYYLGQRPTTATSTALSASLNLDQYGIRNAQITAAGTWNTTNWRPYGPPALALQRLDYYQTFLDGKFELKVGYTTNHYEFFGTAVGGNIISGTLGPGASILFQNGLARTPLTAPAINVRWNAPGNFYVKSGIQRSISPNGPDVEHTANPSGFRFHTPNARALFINEIGYKRSATPDERSTWVRGGVLYNTSPYAVFGTTRTAPSTAYALLADTQLLKTDSKFPARGIYGGASFMKGDPNVDGTDQYYEARVYGVGIIPHRPDDFVSVVYTHNKFSDRVYALTQATGVPAIDRINNVTVSYSLHLAKGVFLNNGIAYGDHASTSPITRPALVFATDLTVVF